MVSAIYCCCCCSCCFCLVAKSCLTLLWRHGLKPIRLLCPWDFPGKNTRVGCHFLLQGIFPTQVLNLHLWHWQVDSFYLPFRSIQFSPSVLSDSLRPHGLQHARPPCTSTTPGVYSNSCPLSQWCHPTISSSVIPFSHLQSFPASGLFKWVSSYIRWPKYWSFGFNISPSNEYLGYLFTSWASRKPHLF